MKAALQTHETSIMIIMTINITRSLSQQVHSLFQSEFSKQHIQLLPRSVLKHLLVSHVIQEHITSYSSSSRHYSLSLYLPFNNVF